MIHDTANALFALACAILIFAGFAWLTVLPSVGLLWLAGWLS